MFAAQYNTQNPTDKYGETTFIKKTVGALLNETVYYINKSKSKWVAVGFGLENHYKPVIKLAGQKNNQYVIFNEYQWASFLNNQGIILSFIYSNNFGYHSIRENDYELHFVFIDGSRILQIKQAGGNEIFLGGDSINELISLTNIIKYRFDMLMAQDFSKYYNILISAVSLKNGDLIKNVYDIVSPTTNINSENVCCVLEMLNIYSDCLFEDVESYACNNFVKKCIEK